MDAFPSTPSSPPPSDARTPRKIQSAWNSCGSMTPHKTALLALTLTAAQTFAQTPFPEPVLGVTASGSAVVLDPYTGLGRHVGPTGSTGHNGMARIGATVWTTEQVGIGNNAQYFLNRISDVTGAAVRTRTLTRDIRALAEASGSELFGIAQASPTDELVRIQVNTGAITVVGPTGFSSLQGLAVRRGRLFGWDLVQGLIRISPSTGAGTDVDPAVGSAGANIQFLSTFDGDLLLGGEDSLFLIDPNTGIPSLRGSGAYSDLRGAEARFGVMYTFGAGCAGMSMAISGTPNAGSTITSVSVGNQPQALGMMFLGFSDRNFGGLPLPVRLTSIFGTAPDCFGYAGAELTVAATADQSGQMNVPIAVPLGLEGLVFHLQHMSLSNAPGGMQFSNGASVRLRL
ncbi:MAG: hypothetical protein IPK26_27695 [Planctomycetes bacterium]|nr:hypothetical protein [Planctomycetota bacterium]